MVAFRVEPSLAQKALLLVLLPVVCQLIFVATLSQMLLQAEREVWEESHSKNVVAESNALIKAFYDLGVALVTYAYGRSTTALEQFYVTAEIIPWHLRTLEFLVKD